FNALLGLMTVRSELGLKAAKVFVLVFAPFVAADIVAVPWICLVGTNQR
ncbi:MAG: hypothetical protein FJY85_19195, partial [Deltaproteobacteria bacterium]|nr:hypothetical protein [Deltaproteobacteria bacterium]